MDAEERAENLTRQAEEAEALSAIYGEDFAVEDGAWTVRVPLFRDPERAQRSAPPRLGADGEPLPAFLTARCVPLETYPSRTCFLAEVCSLPSGALDAGELARLATSAWAEAPGEVAGFAFVERLREACAAFADGPEDAPDAKKEGHGDSPEIPSDEPHHRPVMYKDPFDPEALAAELAAIDARGGAADASSLDEEALLLETEIDPTEIDPSRVRHGAPFVERKSTFQAHVLLGLRSVEEADAFAAYLKRDPKVARASHNILAYRKRLASERMTKNKNGDADSERDAESSWACDHDDDGEHGAGKGLSHILRVTESEDVCVVVSRWFGGVHLGPQRFQCINNAARDALVQAGVARTNAGGKSGSGKSGKRSGGGAK